MERIVPPIYVAVLTALDEEDKAVRCEMSGWQLMDGGWYFNPDCPAALVCFHCMREMGPDSAATETAHVLDKLDPDVVLLCGITGGFSSRGAKVGDVIVARRVIGYDGGVLTATRRKSRWQVFPLSKEFCDQAEQLTQADYEIHVGDLLSGSQKWRSSAHKEAKTAKRTWDKALGVEMEAAGVCRAVASHKTLRPPSVVVCKGVSDGATPSSSRTRRTSGASTALQANRDLGRLRSASVASALIRNAAVRWNWKSRTRALDSMRARITRCYDKATGHFVDQPGGLAAATQKWTTACAALGLFDLTASQPEQVVLDRVVESLAEYDARPSGYGLEGFADYPLTVVTATIGMALLHLGSLPHCSSRQKALKRYSQILRLLEKMWTGSGLMDTSLGGL